MTLGAPIACVIDHFFLNGPAVNKGEDFVLIS